MATNILVRTRWRLQYRVRLCGDVGLWDWVRLVGYHGAAAVAETLTPFVRAAAGFGGVGFLRRCAATGMATSVRCKASDREGVRVPAVVEGWRSRWRRAVADAALQVGQAAAYPGQYVD